MTTRNLEMSGKLLILAACTGSLLIILSVKLFGVNTSNHSKTDPATIAKQAPKLSEKQLERVAHAITVKVFSDRTWGSGILVRRNDQSYTVLSSAHLLGVEDAYRVQTPDGKIYSAKLLKTFHANNNDISLLEFSSNHSDYEIASLQRVVSVVKGDTVFAAGFSFEAEAGNSTGFVITQGQISCLLERALANGYQIGYTNDVGQGMSGGPLLNSYGQVVGINGLDKYPLWGNPYVFQDGSLPSKEIQERMRHSSWAVPIQAFLRLEPL